MSIVRDFDAIVRLRHRFLLHGSSFVQAIHFCTTSSEMVL